MKYGKVMKLVDLLTRHRKMLGDLVMLMADVELAKDAAGMQMMEGGMRQVVIGGWDLQATVQPDGKVELVIKEIG